MKHLLTGAAALLSLAAPAMAHEVWIERDGAGPGRIYLGEPADETQDTSEHSIKQIRAPVVFTADRGSPLALTRRTDHIEVAAVGLADLRLYDESVFAPWTEENVRQAQVFHARAGRTDITAKLDFELVPLSANADSFTVTLRGRPVAGATVTIVSPAKWQKTVKADVQGRIAVPDQGKGRYILIANAREDGEHRVGSVTVARLHHVSTLSYMKP